MKEVSAGGVVYFKDKNNIRLLMIEDKCNRWTLPKGKNEEGETYQETAIREIFEETGVEGKVVKPLDQVNYEYYHPNSSKVEKVVYYYLVEAQSTKLKVQLSEINSAQWVNPANAWEKQKSSGYDNNLQVMKMALKELGFDAFE